jgi:hypothetical protein
MTRMRKIVQTSLCVQRALALAGCVLLGACNEYDGTDPWPGVYPPESEIDRPKGADAGAKDGGADASAGDAAQDAAPVQEAGASDAGMDGAVDVDAAAADSGSPEGGSEAGLGDAASDAAPLDAATQG